MRRNLWCGAAMVLLFFSSLFAQRVGEAAPEFQTTDSNGQAHKLSQYRGKFGSSPKSVINIPRVTAIWHSSDKWPR
jgi:hypothetical protein